MATLGRSRSTAQLYVVVPLFPATSVAFTSNVCSPLATCVNEIRPLEHPTALPSTVHLVGPAINSSGSNRKDARSLRVFGRGAVENATVGAVVSTRKNHPAAGWLTSSDALRARTSKR